MQFSSCSREDLPWRNRGIVDPRLSRIVALHFDGRGGVDSTLHELRQKVHLGGGCLGARGLPAWGDRGGGEYGFVTLCVID